MPRPQNVQTVLVLSLLLSASDGYVVPAGAGYVGAGYNILIGNNDGDHLFSYSGGPDAGMLSTKMILDKVLASAPGEDYCADQSIVCMGSAEETTDNQEAVVADLQQLQRLYATAWIFDSDPDEPPLPLETDLAGSRSATMNEAKEVLEAKGNVILDTRNIITVAELRMKYKSTGKLTTEFLNDLCNLPADYNRDVYRRFFSTWGTHVVVAVKVGRLVISRDEIPVTSLNNLIMKAPSLASIVHLDVATSSVSYDSSAFQNPFIVEKIIELAKQGNFSGTIKHQFTRGTPSAPTPIQLTLRRIDTLLTKNLLDNSYPNMKSYCPNYITAEDKLNQTRANMRQGLYDYPQYFPSPSFGVISRSFQLDWPHGTYALIKNTNCPETGTFPMWSAAGSLRLRDRFGMFAESLPSTEFDVQLTPRRGNRADLTMKFCVKYADGINGRYDWPMGSYCIFKKDKCPAGFAVGSISIRSRKAFLENDALPDGYYLRRTSNLEFCCRNDRAINEAIILPTTQPFTLLSSGGQCQKVQGMRSSLRVQSFRKGELSGIHPYITSNSRQRGVLGLMRLYFCYYQPNEP
ncbi:uncharacterized protein LOC129580925 [Paramacrobiotus metropolitanus]|uniref:uncharacterized protein LOC129580925 n=1 Tax=Paramacrobiotus metropolitanus TaxID=2943436 RepID=UPI002445B577|nr:uncharacterized protein LOC129580925 [Paramacrobiotus metropolitanus]